MNLINPIACYAALDVSGNLIMDSISLHKKECFKVSNKVIKIGLQLNIEMPYNFNQSNQPPKETLVKKCWCVCYKEYLQRGNYFPIGGSIKNSAKEARDSVGFFNSKRYKAVQCSITLLTQPQRKIYYANI